MWIEVKVFSKFGFTNEVLILPQQGREDDERLLGMLNLDLVTARSVPRMTGDGQ